ncbi:FxSxx-COOH system tetratricopeptide repeat protein [Kitasatospora sp. NPDC051853]|uniref:FxSxx-COOH system tetratricopeptide repeat protein n=1 Tax=Kitasatospora sp. NPDC051853 TaxID=3364058 RepID=UPI00378C2B18
MTISTGQVVHAAPRQPASWPHQVGRIPPRAGSFQDRAEAARLAAVLESGGTAVVGSTGQVRVGGVLTGLGGVGKTQLAADYARTAWTSGRLDVLVWITAASRAAIADGLAQAGSELLGAEPEVAVQAFLAWLEPKPNERPCRWLIVLDDVADPQDLRGWWPPQSPHGRTLVTTRRRDAVLAGGGRRMVEVGLFTPDEALAYLTDILADHGRHEPDHELRALAADLGHLPLALSQAAAYLIDAGITTTAYRALLADRTRTLADVMDALPDDQPRPLAATWTLSIERANTLAPAGLAAPMLRLASFLDPNGIPESVLTTAPALVHFALSRGVLAGVRRRWWWPGRWHTVTAVMPAEAAAALRVLHRLGLITHDPDTPHQAVRVHQLVQRAVRDTLTPAEHDHTAHRAADALLAAWPDIETDTALAQALRASTDALTGHALDALHRPGAHEVLFRAGSSLGESGQVAAARDYFHHLANSTHHHLGPDHPHTLAARHNGTYLRGEAGDVAGAAAALERVLADQLRVLGPDHPQTLITRHNRARWRGQAGDAVGAAAAFKELLADQLRVLGPDHPQTLNTRHNLARWRVEAEDAAGDAAALEGVLADQLRVLGPDHPDTLNTRHNLAVWRGNTGDLQGAAAAFEELLADSLRVLGPDHPDTLNTRHNLATWQGTTGDLQGAAAAFEQLLADSLRVLGPDHPDTLNTRHSLIYWQTQAGEVADG